jgi:aspartyl/asparaginyl beta-hydroxylase (cupin superfamily)
MFIIIIFISMFFYIGYLLQTYVHIWRAQAYLKYIIQKNPNEYIDKDIYFPDNRLLEANWKVIKQECEAIIQTYGDSIPKFDTVEPGQKYIIENGTWKTYMLRIFNINHENTTRCPETIRLLNRCKGIRNAFFSILMPNTRLSPHTGPCHGVYRYHLPLIVPESDKCELVVNGKSRRWVEGEGFMFDDTYLHSASNNGTKARVVLFIDINRNDLNMVAHICDRFLNMLLPYTLDYKDMLKLSQLPPELA